METLTYDRKRLYAAIRDFGVITKVSVSVLDRQFRILSNYSGDNIHFCKEIQKTACGREKCLCSDLRLLQKCQTSRKTEYHICHAGIMDAVVPVIQSDCIIGYVMIGRIRAADFDESKINWMGADYRKMQTMYEEITAYDETQIGCMLELAAMTVSFLLTNQILNPKLDAFFMRVSDYVDKHLSEKLSIEQLCRDLNVSKNSLYEKFHLTFGMTVNEYILSKRLQKGRKMLLETEYPVSQIAEEIGMNSYNYFSRLFKEKYILSPTKFRKVCKE